MLFATSLVSACLFTSHSFAYPWLPSTSTSPPYTLRVAQQARGILTVTFDPSKPANESQKVVDTNTQGGYLPQWLHAYENKIYTMSRTFYPTNASASGGIYAFDRKHSESHQSGAAGGLELLDSTSSDGRGGVYVDVSKDGRTLSAANIDGSTVSVHPLSKNGQVKNASYVFRYELPAPNDPSQHPGMGGSQLQANPHEAIFDPSGEYMFVPDRGSDRLYVYQVGGPYDVAQIRNITLPPGTGPRHMTFQVFSCSRTIAYLVSELDNTVRVYTVDGVVNEPWYSPAGRNRSSIDITLVQTASTLGPGRRRTAPNNNDLAAELAITNDGKFLYVSNRNTVSYASDTIAIYSVNANSTSQHLTYIGHNETYGKIPRHFSLSKDAESRFVAIGNEVSNNLVILERNVHTGYMAAVVGELKLGGFDTTQTTGPTAIVWD